MIEPEADKSDGLLIDLNFVPSWARKPPSGALGGGRESAGFEDRAQNGRSSSRRGGGGGGASPEGAQPLDGGRRAASGQPVRAPVAKVGVMRGGRPFDRDSSSRASTGTQGRRDFGDRGRGPFNDSSFPGDRTGDGAPGDERLKAIEVSFLPERHGLAPLAHRLARSWRAYSLFEVASLFLSKPEYHAIKLEVRPGPDSTVELFQCLGCKAVFLNRDALANHAFSKHFDRFCRKEETEGEAPKGNFVCVSRCGLSGALLGPPNYHSYNERVLEIHRTRYPGMPIEAYRQRIETLHDPAMIEKWKE
ncbi:MAG: hypothetical protein WCS01_13615, partial [bacterium]